MKLSEHPASIELTNAQVAHSEQIYEALAGEKQIWLVEGARHARSVRNAKRE